MKRAALTRGAFLRLRRNLASVPVLPTVFSHIVVATVVLTECSKSVLSYRPVLPGQIIPRDDSGDVRAARWQVPCVSALVGNLASALRPRRYS